MNSGLHILPEYNTQEHNRDAVMLVDELTSTEYYIGISWNRADQSKPTWRIKRIWKVGTVWHFGFPQPDPKQGGNQEFKWIWDDRYSYSYAP
jgi:hypothetical protein